MEGTLEGTYLDKAFLNTYFIIEPITATPPVGGRTAVDSKNT